MDTVSRIVDTASTVTDTAFSTMDSAWNTMPMNQGMTASASSSLSSPVTLAVFGIVWLAALVFFVVVGWKIFAKAGKPGWACIVPLYSNIVMLEIAGRPLWWILLMFIPFVNLVILIIVLFDINRKFGKGVGFGLGLLFLGFIFGPILAFGDAKYDANA